MPFPTLPSDKGIILATGPSLSAYALHWAKMKQRKGWSLFGINNVYQQVPELDVFLACNPEWWDQYWTDTRLQNGAYPKWTWDLKTYRRYGGYVKYFNYIDGKWGDSLSKDPEYIHYGHASGYQILGIAYHYGIREFYLLGYDMSYPPGKLRHYFGEYPKALYHNPRTGPNGEFIGLIRQFETIDEADLGIKVYNLCPTSALEHFEKGHIDDF
jgi:hypothetical protein